ncbi:MAG: hypothetical protein KBF98_15020 [Rhodoferax sp.]|nr:hypothetical protein [Rhodoferax sp.]
MIKKIALTALLCLPLLNGCGTSAKAPSDSGDTSSQAPAPDAQLAVKQFVDAHSAVMGSLGEIKSANKKLQSDVDTIKSSNQKTLETSQRSLQILEEMSKRQGTGELTVFFPVGSADLPKGGLEYDRLVRFSDFVARESRGRKIILLSIGSASALGNQKGNLNLAKKRSEVPLDIMNKYLINAPHEFHKVFGTGDTHSPKGVKLKEHQRYQHTRIIAVFDKDQAPNFDQAAKPW